MAHRRAFTSGDPDYREIVLTELGRRAMIRTYLFVNGARDGHGHLIKTGLLIGLSTGSVILPATVRQLDLVPACF